MRESFTLIAHNCFGEDVKNLFLITSGGWTWKTRYEDKRIKYHLPFGFKMNFR